MDKIKNRIAATAATIGLLGGVGLATAAPASAAYDGYQVIVESTKAECEMSRDMAAMGRWFAGASEVWTTLCGPGMYNNAGKSVANVYWTN